MSVRKNTHSLREPGSGTLSTPQGDRLESDPDSPFPWEFPQREGLIHYSQSVGSTMDGARDLARRGCPEMTVVVAEQQTQGRGRMDRQWISNPQGLYFTIVTRPRIGPAHAARVGFAAAVSLARVARDAYGVPAEVKWPNDVLVAERKLMGILSEMETSGDKIRYINVGMGINVNHHPDGEKKPATSLKRETGKKIPRKEVLEQFLTAFEVRLTKIHTPAVMAEWKELTLTLGRDVEIVTRTESLRGLAVDVSDTGALVLESKSGERRLVHYGDCFLLPPGYS